MNASPSTLPDYQLEREWAEMGAVIGVDEAGRGPWAGPVTAAAFWINPEDLNHLPPTLTDSKKLSEKQREAVRAELASAPSSHIFSYHHIHASEIDKLGLLPATFLAMRTAIEAVAERLEKHGIQISHILVDGNIKPDWHWPSSAIIKGDSKSLSIAAASIIAKTARDGLMTSLASEYPVYDWQNNNGYGTKAHQNALIQHGTTPHHRTSFAPIKKLLKDAD